MAKATKGNCKSRHAFPAFILSLLYIGASQCGKKQEFKNYLGLGFFSDRQLQTTETFHAGKQPHKGTTVWDRKTRNDRCPPPAGTWPRLRVSPGKLAPHGIQPRWGWILLGLPAAHVPWVSSSGAHPGMHWGSEKDPWVLQDKRQPPLLCWHPCRWYQGNSLWMKSRTISQSLSPEFAPQMKAHFKPKLV